MSTNRNSIKDWSEEDRPREKLLLKGPATLSEAELLAILIGSGNSKESAVELCRRIMRGADNNLHDLAALDIADLISYKGIGEAKAISIIAAMELGRRRSTAAVRHRIKCIDSHTIWKVMGPMLRDLPHEEFWILTLNNSLEITRKINVGRGGITAVIADDRLIWKHAISNLATSIVLVHNHPSGARQPSKADMTLTDRLVEGGKLLNIIVQDHVIIAGDSHYSMRDEGHFD